MMDAHQLLDKLMENLKTDLMKNLTERIKNEILAEVELKNKALCSVQCACVRARFELVIDFSF